LSLQEGVIKRAACGVLPYPSFLNASITLFRHPGNLQAGVQNYKGDKSPS